MSKLFYKFTATLFVLCLLWQCNETAEDKKKETRILANSETFLPNVEDKYVYSIVPGTDAWKDLGTTEEVYKISQLPDSILQSISTLGLIGSILDIPGLPEFYLVSNNSSPIGTFYHIFVNYNSAGELEKREDSGSALFSYYNAVNISKLESLNIEAQNRSLIQLSALEILFTKPAILKRFDLKQKKQLIALLLSKYEQIKQWEEFISSNGTVTAIAWILYNSNYAPVVQYYGNNVIAEIFEVLNNQADDIIVFANNFIHN